MSTEEKTKALIKAIQSGDSLAFEELSEKYNSVILSTSISIAKSISNLELGDADEVLEDLKQEARLALYRAALKYDADGLGESVTFGLYAKICIKNCLISELRRRKAKKRREVRLSEAAERASEKEASRIALSRVELEELLKSSARLLSKYEQAVLMEYAEGNSVPEISEKFGKPQKSVNNALYRIRVKLRSLQMKF